MSDDVVEINVSVENGNFTMAKTAGADYVAVSDGNISIAYDPDAADVPNPPHWHIYFDRDEDEADQWSFGAFSLRGLTPDEQVFFTTGRQEDPDHPMISNWWTVVLTVVEPERIGITVEPNNALPSGGIASASYNLTIQDAAGLIISSGDPQIDLSKTDPPTEPP